MGNVSRTAQYHFWTISCAMIPRSWPNWQMCNFGENQNQVLLFSTGQARRVPGSGARERQKKAWMRGLTTTQALQRRSRRGRRCDVLQLVCSSDNQFPQRSFVHRWRWRPTIHPSCLTLFCIQTCHHLPRQNDSSRCLCTLSRH